MFSTCTHTHTTDNPLPLPDVTASELDISLMMATEDTLYITTSTGKIISMPIAAIMAKGEEEQEQEANSGLRPQVDHLSVISLRKKTSISLDGHKDIVKGILHIQLPESTQVSPPLANGLSSSTLNLSGMQTLSPAISLPSLLDTTDHTSTVASHSNTPAGATPSKPGDRAVYRSLLVSAGRGHKNYLTTGERIEENTALRERNDAHQLMVWGFPNT